MTTITQLPDLCTSTIFKGIPLAQLITNLSRVCTNWNTLQRVELGQRKRLVLGCDGRLEVDLNDLIESVQKINNQYGNELIEKVEDDDGKPWARVLSPREIEFNLIRVFSGDRVYTMTEDFTTTLLDNLKGLTHLTVVLNLHCFFKQSANTSLTQLARIIDHYGASLVSLKLDINYYEPTEEPLGVPVDHPLDDDELLEDEAPIDDDDDLIDEDEPSDQDEIEIEVQGLFDAINRIQKQLNHVSLNIIMPSAQLADGSFAFLERVHSFKTDNFVIGNEPFELLLSTFAQHATGGACSHIENGTCFELGELIQLDRQLAAKFRRLVVSQGEEIREEGEGGEDEDEDAPNELANRNMRRFGNQFASLRSLELLDLHMPITKIARSLYRLTELIHLKLEGQFEVEINNQPGGQLVITPLPSVRLLVLDVYGSTHSDIERMHLGEIFPNLQVLRYESMHSSCEECDIRIANGETSRQRRTRLTNMVTCVRLTLQSLPRLIPRLRLVQYAPDVDEQDGNTLHVGMFNLEQLNQLVDVPLQ